MLAGLNYIYQLAYFDIGIVADTDGLMILENVLSGFMASALSLGPSGPRASGSKVDKELLWD